MNDAIPDKQILIDMVSTRMPFGKHKGLLVCDLPENYLLWFHKKGFPEGKLGKLMEQAFEIKLNGLDEILHKIKAIVQKHRS